MDMRFNIGDKVRVNPATSTRKHFHDYTGVVTHYYFPYFAAVRLVEIVFDNPSYGSWFFEEIELELLYPVKQLSVDLLKEDDNSGRVYNPITDTWSWL